MKKQSWIVAFIILIAAIVVTASIAWTRYRPSLPIEITLPPPQTVSGNIYVGGAVNNPGIYTFSGVESAGARPCSLCCCVSPERIRGKLRDAVWSQELQAGCP